MHFRIEPARVVESASLDKGDSRHDGGIREDWRPALRTKVSLNGLAAIPRVVERLELSLNRHRWFRNADQHRKRGPSLPLTVGAVANADEDRICIRRISDVAAETAAGQFRHSIPPVGLYVVDSIETISGPFRARRRTCDAALSILEKAKFDLQSWRFRLSQKLLAESIAISR
jgi:hypothetical protein